MGIPDALSSEKRNALSRLATSNDHVESEPDARGRRWILVAVVVGVAASAGALLILRGSQQQPDRLRKVLKGHAENIFAISASSDGPYLASLDTLGGLYVWDLRTGEPISQLKVGSRPAQAVALSPDSWQLAVADAAPSFDEVKSRLEIWDVSDTPVRRLAKNTQPNKIISSLAFSGSGEMLALAIADPPNRAAGVEIKLMDTLSGEITGSAPLNAQWVHSLALSPGGDVLAISTINTTGARGTGKVELWDTDTLEPRATLGSGFISVVTAVAFSPDGSRLASAGPNGTSIDVWDVATGRKLKSVPFDAIGIHSLAFSRDGSKLAAGGSAVLPGVIGSRWLLGPGVAMVGPIQVWETETWQSLVLFESEHEIVDRLDFGADGTSLISASSSDSVIKIWDLASDFAKRDGGPADEPNESTGN